MEKILQCYLERLAMVTEPYRVLIIFY